MRLFKFLSLIVFVSISTVPAYSQTGSAQTYAYPSLGLYKTSENYKVEILANNGTKIPAILSAKTPAADPTGAYCKQTDKTLNALIFSFTGRLKIKITKLNSSATQALVRPTRFFKSVYPTTRSGNDVAVTVELDRPRKISVEFNDDPTVKNPLLIFAMSMEDRREIPDTLDKTVLVVHDSLQLTAIDSKYRSLYFPPGLVSLEKFNVPKSVRHIYVAGGAILSGYIYAKRDRDSALEINGRGIVTGIAYRFHYPNFYPEQNITDVSPRPYKMIFIDGGRSHVIDGITMLDASEFNILISCDSAVIRNVNIAAFRLNTDAVTEMGKSNQVINCFIRNNDDGIVFYGINLSVSHCVFWSLGCGSSFQLGWKPLNKAGANSIRDCDLIHGGWDSTIQNGGFINAMNYTKTDVVNPLVSGLTVDSVFVDSDITRFVDMRMVRGSNRQTVSFQNIRFSHIYFNQSEKGLKHMFYFNGTETPNTLHSIEISDIYSTQGVLDSTSLQGLIKSDATLSAIHAKGRTRQSLTIDNN